MSKTDARFEEWEEVKVSCNECLYFYEGNCDGHVDFKSSCKQFVLYRAGRIDELLTQIKWYVVGLYAIFLLTNAFVVYGIYR